MAVAEDEPSWLVQFDRLSMRLQKKALIRALSKGTIPQVRQCFCAFMFFLRPTILPALYSLQRSRWRSGSASDREVASTARG
jgi:hypothetical protein